MRKFVLLFVLIFLAFVACKKRVGEYELNESYVAGSNYTLQNLLGKSVSFDIYVNGADYIADTGAYIHGTVAANAAYQIPATKFDPNKSYIIDWYQDDYKNSNWMDLSRDSTLSLPGFKLDAMHTYYIQATNPENLWRSVLLDNDKSFTRWAAVDARTDLSSGSVWQQLNSFQQYFTLVFFKNYQCKSYYKDSSTGVLNESPPTLYVTESATSVRAYGPGFSTFSSTKTVTGSQSDTFWAHTSNRYYAMVKQL